ncbi:MAG: deoxyribonuclease IV [Planctomycetes bacterium]|nr:deoxyribonuclease IV [Planctomycetota bacterium]
MHVSISGGVDKAIERAGALGCDCFQIFVANPRSWASQRISKQDAGLFREKRAVSGLGPLVVHMTYLPNLASPDPAIHKKSLKNFLDQYEDATMVGADLFVIHPGSSKGEDRTKALRRLAESVRSGIDKYPDGPKALLEVMAGGGSIIGGLPEELAEADGIISRPEKTGICFDTAHAFAAGYEIDKPNGMAKLRKRFHKCYGRHPISLIHLNDLRSEFGSKHDRHEHIGKGNLGPDGIRNVLRTPGMRSLPVILETPVDESRDDMGNLAEARKLSLPQT